MVRCEPHGNSITTGVSVQSPEKLALCPLYIPAGSVLIALAVEAAQAVGLRRVLSDERWCAVTSMTDYINYRSSQVTLKTSCFFYKQGP